MRTKILVVSVVVCAILWNGAQAASLPSRAVSLRALSTALRTGRMAAQAECLCGITRLSGFVIDSKSKDIVVVGKVDPSQPPLHLDDFVVALRNAWHLYTQTRGRVRYYADPGCSIDPNPRVLGQLRDLQSSPLDFADKDQVNTRMNGWREIGKQPQNVRVMGVPFDTHFAKVMVDADYYMKRLVNGSVTLSIGGFESLSDMEVNQIRASLHASDVSAGPESSMSRFWFSPGECTYEDGDGFVILRSCTVKLLTEEEFLNEHGGVSGMGRPHPLAARFARDFTAKYADIANQRPIYKQLQALFAFSGLARLMKEYHADSMSPGALGYLLKTYKVSCTPVSRAVNGLTDIRTVNEPVEASQGKQIMTVIQSTCGGVSMSVRPKRVATVKQARTPNSATMAKSNVASAKTTRTAKGVAASKGARTAARPDLKHAVLSSKRSANALSWDVPSQFD